MPRRQLASPARLLVLLVLAVAALAACGGLAVIDPEPSGDGGATTTTSSSVTTAGGTGGAGGTTTVTTATTAVTTSTGCVPLTCADLPCGVEAPDGCGGFIFCSCNSCSVERFPIGGASGPELGGTQPWADTEAIVASDNADASVSLPPNSESHFLYTVGLGFAIPERAIVTGIAVRIERSANGNQVFDSRVSLIRDGGASPFNFAASSPWATSDVVQSYGGNGELWGETWSASQINDETFGVILQVGSLGGFALARVDAMSIEVFYEADDCNR